MDHAEIVKKLIGSETKQTIFTKLLEFQSKVEVIKKDGKNSFFKKPNGKESSYATLPNILAEVKPILNELNLVLTQPIVNNEVFSVITDIETGEQEKSSILIPGNLNAQQIGSAITYFRRYTLSSLLSLEIDEDDDGNKGSQPAVAKIDKVLEKLKIDLATATTVEDLAKVYMATTPEYRKLTLKLKEERKAKLSKLGALPYLNENSADFTEMKAHIHSGGTMDEVESKFQISDTVRELLLTQ